MRTEFCGYRSNNVGQSSIRVLEQSPERLVLYQPPYWIFGIGFVVAGILIAGLLFAFLSAQGVRTAVRFVGFVLALPFLYFGISALTAQTFVELSARDRTLKIQKVRLFQAAKPRVIGFDEILRVVELQARRSYAVGVVLRTGETVDITGYGDQPGKPLMIAAIDEFLARAR